MDIGEIKTPALTLRAIRAQDRDELVGILTDERVYKSYMLPDLDTEEKKTALFERYRSLSESKDRFVRGVYLNDRLIGFINEVSVENGRIELGYVIAPAEQNRGYATETLRAATEALLAGGFCSVRTGAFSENGASIRVMEKCGMRRTDETETVSYRGADHLCVYYETV